jgi:C4-dicarboxylate transporter DctM subunit
VSSALTRIFDLIDTFLDALGGGLRRLWRSFAEGPLQGIAFWLILCLTGLAVLVRGLAVGVDRLVARLEQGFIVVALLAMTGLSFMGYFNREFAGVGAEIPGGANMAVALMVWVGFLGASLATREGSHLAVDAADKLLSPRAARLSRRFSSLLAAAFCWHFSDYAIELMSESLVGAHGHDGLPLWDWLVAPLNAVGMLLLSPDLPIWALLGGTSAITVGALVLLSDLHRGGRKPGRGLVIGLEVIGALSLFIGALVWANHEWNPSGEGWVWSPLKTSAETIAEKQASFESLKKLIGDTGGAGSGGGAKDMAALVADSSGGQAFPMWVTQSILPLSFMVMAARFFGRALLFDFASKDDVPVPTTLVEDTGRGTRDLLIVGLFPGILLGIGAAMGLPTGWLIFIAAILVVLVGAPLFLAIGIAAVGSVVLIQDIGGYSVAKDMFEALKKEELLALPFFVLAGNIMTQGTIAERLVAVARAALGQVNGGLGLATVLACVIFAAISGSSPVTVIAVGGIMFPMLVKERYPEGYSLGVLTSAGSLGIIIPPSVPMIIYAIMVSDTKTQISPNQLFVAGVGPGLFIAAMLAIYTLYRVRPGKAQILRTPPVHAGGYWVNLAKETRRSFFALMLPVLILGGIYGILGPLTFTVTEAAAVSVVYALFVELLIHRELKPKDLPRVLHQSGTMMGSLFLIIVLAIAFNKFLAAAYIPQNAAALLQEHVHSKFEFLILVNLFLLALGCLMEIISAILIVAPLLAPIAASYGIDPVHFGIIFIVNLELGYLTPPMGINLFVASTVFKRPIVDVIKGALPFLGIMLFCLAVVSFFPQLSLFLLPEDRQIGVEAAPTDPSAPTMVAPTPEPTPTPTEPPIEAIPLPTAPAPDEMPAEYIPPEDPPTNGVPVGTKPSPEPSTGE